ncbi:MAG: TIGR02281 family clan AA aspartic protease [Gammaproteobacteria bacterium]|nr:MAG: TIGR02281 family clan AA aspartic protease [Gammaproteobacteria bacterium]
MMRALLVLFLAVYYSTSYAVENIQVQGLFSKKVVVLVDGQRHIVSVGKVSPEGVKVISVDSDGAVLEVEGQRKHYNLGSTVITTFRQPEKQQEKIFKNSGGMYMTYGNINGRSVRFLIDTGASAIAMNAAQAKHLGIRYDKYGVSSSVSTASGYAKAFRVHLKSVSVGDITQTNVDAFVIDGDHPGPILLGMTFLGRLSVEHNGNAMTLTQKK